jgi:tetratricopeptide (TPR) repeat protein
MQKIILILCLISGSVQAQDVQGFFNLAKEAYQKKDYNAYYLNLKEANRLHPYHQGILYRLGAAAALTEKSEEAFSYLKKAIAIDANFELNENADLASLKDKKEFGELLALKKEGLSPIINSDTAFVIKDRVLHTEGIEYYPATKTFYLGSIHKRKVIGVNEKGQVSDFTPSDIPELTSVFGLKVDAKRNILWVCSSPIEEMENYDSTKRSGIFKFDLKSKKLISQYKLPGGQRDGIFGDLILNKNGEVFVSDSKNNIIWKVNEKTNAMENFFSSADFWNVNGLAFSSDEKFLFISDYVKGPFRLTMSTKELKPLTNTTDASLKGIDGLYFYKNHLLAIQNGVSPARVTEYWLDKEMSSVTGLKIIDRAHPAFNEPTLGVLVGSSFYYIANSQWSGYINGVQKPFDQLQDIVILKSSLK